MRRLFIAAALFWQEAQISDKPPFIKLELKAQRTMALWQLRINWAININRWTIVAYVHVVKNAQSYHRERGLLKNSSRSSAAAEISR